MSSILTNNSAMVALQTMKKINMNMAQTQSEISTGKSVANAKDNAAVWAISKVMESDVKGFKGISDSLALGSSTVAVAREASETVTELLTEMKGKIVAAQEGNVDRGKIQTDVAKLREQIGSVVGAAQFNGLNLVNGTAGGSVNVLSSLDRSASGVTASAISVTTQNLSIGGYTAKDVFADAATAADSTIVGAAGDTFTMSLDATTGTGAFTISGNETTPIWAAGDQMSMRFGDKTATYTVKASDLSADNSPADMIAVGMKSAIEALGIAGLSVNYDSALPGELAFANTAATGLSVSGQFKNAGSGGLGALSAINVSTAGGANQALGAIEGLLQTSITAAAAFGSSQKQIDIQSEFVGKLSDALKSGIGSMVDANMEETSARLQALQVQQQLATQSLSMANQQPQNILSLFR
jgi:flagellin